MAFQGDINHFREKFKERGQLVHNLICDEAFRSIVEGSPITGAPGQPVDTGNLKGSWQNIIDGPLERRIVTNASYALNVEDNIGRNGPMQLRSQVGGFHSVKLTMAGFPAIVEAVVTRVVGGQS